MAANLAKWPSNRGLISKIRPSDGCKGDTVPSTVVQGYDLRKPGGHLGNVGLTVCPWCRHAPPRLKGTPPDENAVLHHRVRRCPPGLGARHRHGQANAYRWHRVRLEHQIRRLAGENRDDPRHSSRRE